MDRLNELQQQDQQQRQEAAVAEYKVLTTIGTKMKELGFKTVNIAGIEVKLPMEGPLWRAHILIQIGKKAKVVVQRYLVEERGLCPDAD